MTTDCNIVLETPVPHADERTHVLAGEPLVGDKKVLTEVINEESELAKKCELHIPDEKARRVGQSVAAASLPEIK